MLFVVCKQLIFNHKEVWVALAANLPHFGVFTLRWWLDLYLIFLICCKTMLQQCSCFLTACLEPPCQSPSSQGCVHCILLSSIVSPFCLNRKCLLACFIGYQQLNVWVSLLWQEVMFAAVICTGSNVFCAAVNEEWKAVQIELCSTVGSGLLKFISVGSLLLLVKSIG